MINFYLISPTDFLIGIMSTELSQEKYSVSVNLFGEGKLILLYYTDMTLILFVFILDHQ